MLKPDEVQALLAAVIDGATLDLATMREVLALAHVGAVHSIRGGPEEPRELLLQLESLKERMSDKQRAFLSAWSVHRNNTQAAEDAGYARNTRGSLKQTGHETRWHPIVSEAIRVMDRLNEIEAGSDRSEITRTLWTIVKRTMQERSAFDRDGRATGVFEFDPQSATRAIEQLAKIAGMLSQKLEHEWQSRLILLLKELQPPAMPKVSYEDLIAALQRSKLAEGVVEEGDEADREGDGGGVTH